MTAVGIFFSGYIAGLIFAAITMAIVDWIYG